MHDFCTEHDISISTLRRRVEPFKAYLQSKGVTLNTSAWGLEGSELRIRMVILNFFILAIAAQAGL
ncbi:helix-turn-helix domain-containing protein [Lacticaseibacillus manihotivorans]|uniref:helix-turn-helix domain-containing protein n=1 Tax=Lacticaseibacillus manihotivorans TaxID=88233 RepID=UPI0034E2B4D8